MARVHPPFIGGLLPVATVATKLLGSFQLGDHVGLEKPVVMTGL